MIAGLQNYSQRKCSSSTTLITLSMSHQHSHHCTQNVLVELVCDQRDDSVSLPESRGHARSWYGTLMAGAVTKIAQEKY